MTFDQWLQYRDKEARKFLKLETYERDVSKVRNDEEVKRVVNAHNVMRDLGA